MKRLLLLFAFAVACTATAQVETRPAWTVITPEPGNNTYMFVVERATGNDYQSALNNALAKVFRTTMMRIGAVVSWDEVNAALQKGDDWGGVAMQYNIPVNKVCEYSEKIDGGFVVWLLCQVAKSGAIPPEFDSFNGCRDTKNYSNGLAAIRSAVIPGLGQMGKRRYLSGILTLTGEVLLVGGAAYCYIGGMNIANNAKKETDPIKIVSGVKGYNTYRTLYIACASAAGVLYVYNIVRAATMSPKYKDDRIVFVPSLMPVDQTMGMGFSFTLNL